MGGGGQSAAGIRRACHQGLRLRARAPPHCRLSPHRHCESHRPPPLSSTSTRAVASAPHAARVGALARLGFLWLTPGLGEARAQVAWAPDPEYAAAGFQPAVASLSPLAHDLTLEFHPLHAAAGGVSRPSPCCPGAGVDWMNKVMARFVRGDAPAGRDRLPVGDQQADRGPHHLRPGRRGRLLACAGSMLPREGHGG